MLFHCHKGISYDELLSIGGYGIWLAATYAFIADISSPEQVAFRLGMLHLLSKSASPIGPPIGAWLYKTGNNLLSLSNEL